MGLVVGPQGEGFAAERAGDGPLVTDALPVLVRRHLRPRHPADVAAVPHKLVCKVKRGVNKKGCGRHTGPVLHHRQIVFTRC